MLIFKYLLLIALGFVVIKTYIFIADKFNIIDKPNTRSSHTQITVRGGGIIIPLFALFWFVINDFQYPIFFCGLFIVSTISFLDDIFQLSSFLRFSLQIISVVLLLVQLNFFGTPIWYSIPIIIILVGILNIYNFMDGINGITAGYSFSVLVGLLTVNNFQIEFIDNEFIYFIFIALIVFSFFNFRKQAVCFAGDVGSISMAFIIIFLLSILILKTHNLIYILFLSVYMTESTLTIIYRLYLKENILKPHRRHIYQMLANEKKLSHLFISVIYSFAQLLICFIVYFVVKSNIDTISGYLIGFGLISLLLILFATARVQINKSLV